MKALQIMQYGEPLAANDVETPEPQDREVRIKTIGCGVCHSDVHLHDGYYPMGGDMKGPVSGLHTLPFTPGHEIEGVVEAVGPNATLPDGVVVGSRVAVYPWIGCGACPACHRGDEMYCGMPRRLGHEKHGGYAEAVLVPEGKYLIPCEDLPIGRAATLMCSGLTAFSALRKTGLIGTNEPLLIIGAGGVGLMGVALAKTLLERAPVVADLSPAAREAALAAGAAAAVDPGDIWGARGHTEDGFAAVIDFVGTNESFGAAVAAVRRGGAIVNVGLLGGGVNMPLLFLTTFGFRLMGSFVGTLAEAKDVVALAREGRLPQTPLAFRPLAEASAVLDDLRERRIVGRVVLDARQ